MCVCVLALSTQYAESQSVTLAVSQGGGGIAPFRCEPGGEGSLHFAVSQGFALSYPYFSEQRHEEQHLQVKVVNRGPEEQQAANEPFGQSGTR